MATLTTLPYSHKHYDSLLSLMDAADALAASGAVTKLFPSIGRIFLKHNVENVFGLVLLHKNFNMKPTERLVRDGNVSTPRKFKHNQSELRRMAPISWRFTAEGIAPYEFAGDGATMLPHGPNYDEFARELDDLLRDMRLDQLLGFCLIGRWTIEDYPVTLEFPSARGNVTMLDIRWDLREDCRPVEAAWRFGKQDTSEQLKPVVFRKCKNNNKFEPNIPRHTGTASVLITMKGFGAKLSTWSTWGQGHSSV